MGFGRAKVKKSRHACLALVGIAAITAIGCGSEARENLPRPPIPNGVSVQVTADRVDVSPGRVGEEPTQRQQIIADERDGEIQSDSGAPLPVKLTIANTTRRNVRVELVGPARRVSPPVTPNGTEAYMTRLPTGTYRVRVSGRSGRGGQLTVGPDRSSPQNDLLLP